MQIYPAENHLLTAEQPGLNESETAQNQAIADLQEKVASLEAIAKITPDATRKVSYVQSNAQKAPVYIPLGSGTLTPDHANNWYTVNVPQAAIDPADYPGYSAMQLEITMRAFQGNGLASARLFNSNESTAILNSEVSTAMENFTLLTSGGFRLPVGKKTYRIQIKSATGYEVDFQDARIRVNF